MLMSFSIGFPEVKIGEVKRSLHVSVVDKALPIQVF